MTEQQHHHGQTAAAWTTVTILMVASVIGAIGIVSANYTLFWVALGLCVVGLIVGKVMQLMGLGQAPKRVEADAQH